MTKTLFILNDPPYGTERSFNALRLAGALSKREGEEVKLFLMGDAASCAKAHQEVPQGYYNLEVMLKGPRRRDWHLRDVHGRPRHRRGRAHRGHEAKLARGADDLAAVGRQDAGVLMGALGN